MQSRVKGFACDHTWNSCHWSRSCVRWAHYGFGALSLRYSQCKCSPIFLLMFASVKMACMSRSLCGTTKYIAPMFVFTKNFELCNNQLSGFQESLEPCSIQFRRKTERNHLEGFSEQVQHPLVRQAKVVGLFPCVDPVRAIRCSSSDTGLGCSSQDPIALFHLSKTTSR
jgi:hypothetical protein